MQASKHTWRMGYVPASPPQGRGDLGIAPAMRADPAFDAEMSVEAAARAAIASIEAMCRMVCEAAVKMLESGSSAKGRV